MNSGNDKLEYGPSFIMSGGTCIDLFLTSPDRYGKYSLRYEIGQHNRGFEELVNVVKALVSNHGGDFDTLTKPWKYGKGRTEGLVHLSPRSKKQPPVIDQDKARLHPSKVIVNDACKINLRPFYYRTFNVTQFRLPSGAVSSQEVRKEGIGLALNGVMLMQEVSDLFEETDSE